MEKVRQLIQASIDTKQLVLENETLIRTIIDCSQIITEAFKNRNRVYLCGNGGSASDAQHIAAEFTGRFYLDRIALPAEALHCNTSYMTAVANDYSFDVVYSRLVEGIMNKGDILIGLSTSGNSKNIVNAIEAARKKGVITIGFTGQNGGKMRDICQFLIDIPSNDTPRIQESHILVGHIICQLVEEVYFEVD
jgi:D-sedoheptulose 7-phosphate isomerase